MPSRRDLLIAVPLVLAATHAARAAAAAVTIDNFTFAPVALTIARGTTVTWTNRDDIPHTVVMTGLTPPAKSPPLDTDDSFAITFTDAGTFRYFCSLHPHMQGTVVVQ